MPEAPAKRSNSDGAVVNCPVKPGGGSSGVVISPHLQTREYRTTFEPIAPEMRLTLSLGSRIIQSMAMQSTARQTPDTTLKQGKGELPLLQLKVDRRLGHEWDDWDGDPLENGGVFYEGPGLFFRLASILSLIH